MVALDVNVLLNAHRPELPDHELAAEVLRAAVFTGAPVLALAEAVLNSVVRIATDSRVFTAPSTHDEVFGFVGSLRARRQVVTLNPGAQHWAIFERQCRHVDARGNLVTDAWLAALAIEHGAEWVSFDRDFAKFPELRWVHPNDWRHPSGN